MNAQLPKRLLPAKDAAAILGGGVSEGTLANWRCARKGPPYVKIGTLIRYDPDDLARWIAANRCEPERATA